MSDGGGGGVTSLFLLVLPTTLQAQAKTYPLISSAPTASAIISGQTLASSTLSGGAATNAAGATVDGTFSFFSPSTKPAAGTPSETVVFTPTDTTDYNTAQVNVPVMVLQMTITTNNGAITITGYTGSGSSVVIPNIIDGLPVNSIGSSAFSGNQNLTSIIIPTNITSIGTNAFLFCDNLPNVVIPNSVTNIGDFTFGTCRKLTSITIGTNVTRIGNYAFENCLSLTNLTIPNSVTSIGSYAFLNCWSLTNYTIPDCVTNMGDYAFYGCTGLTNISIGDGLASIGNYVFDGCTNLANVTISTNLTSIGSYAFYGCSSLPSVTIPNSVSSIGSYVFNGCTKLTNVIISNGVASIGNYAFGSCSSLPSVTIPNSVTNISSSAFSGCSSLNAINVNAQNSVYSSSGGVLFNSNQTILILCPPAKAGSVTIPNSVTNISSSAFSGCSSLNAINVNAQNSVYSSSGGVLFNSNQTILILCPPAKAGSYTIPSGVISLNTSAFNGCGNLTNVTIASSVANIGDNAFSYSGLTSVIIPSCVTNIGNSVFQYCHSLSAIVISNGVTSMGGGVFFSDYNLTSVTLPNSLTSMGGDVFMDCTALTSVTLPNSISGISGYQFYNCQCLTNITIPNSVTSIGEQAFAECVNLKGIYFQGNAPTNLGAYVFLSANPVIYYLPVTTGWSSTFYNLPTVLWNPQAQNDGSYGVQNNQFGFNIAGSSNLVIVVEACTNFANPVWLPVSTNTLNTPNGTNGMSYFSDPQWMNYPGRFYRISSP